jgi:hypothetical protein
MIGKFLLPKTLHLEDCFSKNLFLLNRIFYVRQVIGVPPNLLLAATGGFGYTCP